MLLWFLRYRTLIRKAKITDAQQICDVLRKSITELCELDHRGDPKELDEWLKNKTVQNCETWLKNDKTNFFVAENNGRIVGVSSINHDGYVGLCYVLPEVKGHGFGARLLEAAETSVLSLGVQSFNLESTITAKGFYEHLGYIQKGGSQDRPKYEKPQKHNKRMQSDRPSAGR